MQTRDPLLNLPLSFIGQAPPIRAQTVEQPAPVIPGTTTTPNMTAADEKYQLPKYSTLDKVIFALTGTPDALLTPEDMRDRTQRRRQAGSAAVQASQDPGEGYMWAPDPGGSGFGLNDIIKLISAGAKLIGGGGGG